MADNSTELDFLAGVRVVDFTQFEAGRRPLPSSRTMIRTIFT